ncbi:MAG: hypothetical protein KGI97_06115, partial [Alphaproteobacteria bacterium]|nr:hypothetical protein [Alphaproteobacteria bacterium]
MSSVDQRKILSFQGPDQALSEHRQKRVEKNKRVVRLAEVEAQIRTYNPNFDFAELRRALRWSRQRPKSSKNKTIDDHFSDPLLIVEHLVKYAKADRKTILASILYPAVRPIAGAGPDRHSLDDIENKFPGGVRQQIENTLRFRALNLPRDGNEETTRLFLLMSLQAAQGPGPILIRGAQLIANLERVLDERAGGGI